MTSTLPAGEHADVIVEVQGTATIAGEANVVVVVDGTANLQGAHVDSLVAIRSTVTLGPGTVVSGDVRTLNSTVTQDPTATVSGTTRDLTVDFAAFGIALATGFFLLFIRGRHRRAPGGPPRRRSCGTPGAGRPKR